jgi:predicted peptidase
MSEEDMPIKKDTGDNTMKMKINRIFSVMFALLLGLILAQATVAQQPVPAKKPMPRFPMRIEPDPRVEQRKYHFEDTNEDLSYVLYVSSKVSKDRKNPLIVALHGLGGDANFMKTMGSGLHI